VDEEQSLIQLIQGIDKMAGDKKVIFPIHPRTKAILGETDLALKNILFVEPQGYLNFMFLIKNSFAVITDSGGISEETTVLGIPCFTMRNNTERPETQSIGTNTLVGTSIENLEKLFGKFLRNGKKESGIPALWDGKASERIIAILLQK
jgi:UDP-N-acetylglucosamine 2-epimerase (non-hydrolysing)